MDFLKTKDGYEQAYNCQAAVDSEHQVIVAETVTSQQNDGDELVAMVEQVKESTGEYPAQVSADANYCSEANMGAMEERGVDAWIATGRQKHGTTSPTSEGDKKSGSRTTAMREKLKEGGFESPWRLRKQVVEPVFGQIKQARGIRLPIAGSTGARSRSGAAEAGEEFPHRGLWAVARDWSMVCTAHNLLKLFVVRAARARIA